MAPMSMKAVQVLTKTGLAEALAAETELKKSDCAKVLTRLAKVVATEVVATEVKNKGKAVIPGVAMIKTHIKPATLAGKRAMFGKVTTVAGKQATTVVKAFPAFAIRELVAVSAGDRELDSEESLAEGPPDGPSSDPE